jgi:LIVCS family branched-chain amino acid:cation transporter
MEKSTPSAIITTGLAIFSMLFGAGNLMYPLYVGMTSGDKNFWGMLGFLITAALLPITGFIGMILFEGDYNNFFGRLGTRVGQILIAISMLIIGPIIAIPRITTLSHTMIAPFIPFSLLTTITPTSSLLFSTLFLGITFIATYRENKIVAILGNIISPLLLISLSIIILKGIIIGDVIPHNTMSTFNVFKENLVLGYGTLDLFGALFFSSIVLGILHATKKTKSSKETTHTIALIGLQAGILGVTLLSIVYIGISLLGAYHGQNLTFVNPGELFREVAFKVVGSQGAAIIATAVLMACLSTSIALSAVVAEYLQNTIFHKNISYVTSLAFVLSACVPLSTAGLTQVVSLTKIIAIATYPVIITLTFCNIAYKLFNFKHVKIPVLLTFIITIILQCIL